MTGVITSLPPLVEQPPGSNSSNPAGLPGSTYTAAIPNLPQTWTALQTYTLNSIQFAGSTSGNTFLNAAAIASGVLTLPAATDTLVGRNTTDTLTSKTLTSPIINGATISGTLTGGTYSGITITGSSTFNGNNWTTGTGTLTLGAGKTATISNTLTLAGTDGTTQTFPATSGAVLTSVSAAGGGLTGTYPNPTVSSVPASALPNPSATTLGGIQSLAAVGSKWINTISTSGVPSATQPAFTDISGQATLIQLPTLAASTVLGSIAGGTPIALTTAQHTSLVNTFTTSLSGAVPSPGTVTGKVLSDNGTWIAAGGTGTVTNVATAGLATGGPITTTGTVTVTAAVKSDQITGTSTAVAVVPNVQQNHASAAKAWCYVSNAAGTYTLNDKFGVTSINKVGTGLVDITLSTAMTTSTYAVILTLQDSSTGIKIGETIGSRSTTNVRVDMRNAAGSNVDDSFSLLVFGTQ